jgi:hypothetical protein
MTSTIARAGRTVPAAWPPDNPGRTLPAGITSTPHRKKPLMAANDSTRPDSPGSIAALKTARLTEIAALPDDAVVEQPGQVAERPSGPGITVCGTPRELSDLIYGMLYDRGWELTPDEVDAQVKRNEQRAFTAAVIGYQYVCYTLTEWTEGGLRYWRTGIWFTNAARPVTKLAYALVFTQPGRVQEGDQGADQEALRMMGYRDAGDVLTRAARTGLGKLTG